MFYFLFELVKLSCYQTCWNSIRKMLPPSPLLPPSSSEYSEAEMVRHVVDSVLASLVPPAVAPSHSLTVTHLQHMGMIE